MKTSTIPSVRVGQELRQQLGQVLRDGETLSAFGETSVRDTVRRGLDRAEFVARGIASLDAARSSGRYVSGSAALGKLQARLDRARRSRHIKATNAG